MNRLWDAIGRRLLSPEEAVLLRAFREERKIAAYHRQGLRQIQRQSLFRPDKLNLGSGAVRKEGFLNVDLFPGGDLTLDLRKGLPFESDCCEVIFSEHCFEHFEYPEPISYLLRECLRVLRPGGTLQFSVPDTEWPLRDYVIGPDAPYFKICEENGCHPSYCTSAMEHINFHFRQGTQHRFAYDFETARKMLKQAGFEDVQSREFNPAIDSEHRRIGSLFMFAQKIP